MPNYSPNCTGSMLEGTGCGTCSKCDKELRGIYAKTMGSYPTPSIGFEDFVLLVMSGYIKPSNMQAWLNRRAVAAINPKEHADWFREKDEPVLTLKQLQKEHAEWVARNFPGSACYHPLLGAMEELGELAHAHLKAEQGIRYDCEEDLEEMKIDAIGDIIIFLADYCTKNGFSLQDAVQDTWYKVKQRDWVNDPIKGAV